MFEPKQLINNRYVIQEKIGQGGMGIVYRAQDRLTGDIIALKRVTAPEERLRLASIDENNDFRMTLTQEFRLLAGLRHPNIISVLDYGFDDELQPYFTMELLEEAQTITDYLFDRPLAEQLEYIMQMIQAILYLHRNGIIHRDLKPDNVVVANGMVKVLDFGLAVVRKNLTELSQQAGTVAYMAPEIFQDGMPSQASDLYAVGVIAYEIFANVHPFKALTPIQTIMNIVNVIPDVSKLNVNHRIKDALQKLLSKSPEERFQNASELIALYAQITDTKETPVIRESFLKAAHFVGRKNELIQLTDALKRILPFHGIPQGSAWLVCGESGIGKSRLLEEIRVQALVEGALVVKGNAVIDGGSLYHLWREVMRQLCLHTEFTDQEAGVLKELVPDISTLLQRKIALAPQHDPQTTQQRLLNVIEAVFRRQNQPTVLLVEDLQWTKESLIALNRVNSIVKSLPLLVIGSFRDDERPNLPDELPDMKVIKLERLRQDEIAELSESMIGENGRNPDVVELLYRETEGNAFFIVEVVRELAEDAGQLEHVGNITLPVSVFAEGIKAVVQKRLKHIRADDLPLLRLAAVIGRSLDLILLKSIHGQRKLDEWLARCVDAAILEVHEGMWIFAHDKLREGILAEINELELQQTHYQVAETIEHLYSDNDQAVVLAYHWGKAGNISKEAYYTALAGEQALSIGAYPKAQVFLARTLELQNQLLDVKLPSSALLNQQLGEVYYALGKYSEARQSLKVSIQLSESPGNQPGTAHSYNILGNIALALGEYQEAELLLGEALRIGVSKHNTLETGKAMRSLGVIAETLGNYTLAKQWYQDSLLMLTEINDEMGIAGTYSNLATIARLEANYVEARKLYEEGLQRFKALNFAWGVAFTLTNLGITLEALRDFEKAQDTHKQAVAICREIKHQWGTAFCLSNLGELLTSMNTYESAQEVLQEALKIALKIQTIPLVLDILTAFVRLMVKQERDKSQIIEQLSFIIHHELTEKITVEKAGIILSEIKEEIGSEIVEIYAERGKSQQLDDILARFLL